MSAPAGEGQGPTPTLDPLIRDLLADPAKAPTVIEDKAAFLREVLVGKHIDEVAVLPRGLDKLGLTTSMPEAFRASVEGQDCLCGFLDSLAEKGVNLRDVDASMYYWDGKKEHRVKRSQDGKRVKDLAGKYEALKRNRDTMREPLYLGELRYTQKRKLPDGDHSRTLLTEDVKDLIGDSRHWMPMWDRGHAFVGGELSGSSLHCDQTLWSNVGKNWAGFKLLFVWKFGDESMRVLDKYFKEIIKPPFSREEAKVLKSAAKVVLVRPGDVYVFSGANAHMTLGVGRPLSLTAYESFVNLNPVNVAVFRRSGTREHFEECIMSDTDLEDLKDDVVDNIEDMLVKLQGRADDIEAAIAEDSRNIQGLIPAMIRELCHDKFYRRELCRIRRIRKTVDRVLEAPGRFNKRQRTRA